ncbi:MAG: response regulator [Anaerolineales bacterium]|nr:MAG: response regulator [Anaerolineales bacterium]
MNTVNMGHPVEILIVEDNPGDVRLMQEAMRDSKVLNKIHVVEDGVAAMAYLHRDGEYADVPCPDLIMLDLNLPMKDGREVLVEIKEDTELRRIPVVILTTSGAEDDILRTYNHHANCYITKPIDLQQFINVVRAIENFWLTIVKLPPDGNKRG